MNKTIGIRPPTQPIKTTVRLDGSQLDQIHKAMQKDGYGQKQRSLWISEAIVDMEKLLLRESDEDASRIVGIFWVAHGKDSRPTPITLNEDAVESIQRIVARLSKIGHQLDDRYQRLVSMAISQRLIMGRSPTE